MTDHTVPDSVQPEHQQPCGCGRSATGFCTGLHNLSDDEWDALVFDEAFNSAPDNQPKSL